MNTLCIDLLTLVDNHFDVRDGIHLILSTGNTFFVKNCSLTNQRTHKWISYYVYSYRTWFDSTKLYQIFDHRTMEHILTYQLQVKHFHLKAVCNPYLLRTNRISDINVSEFHTYGLLFLLKEAIKLQDLNLVQILYRRYEQIRGNPNFSVWEEYDPYGWYYDLDLEPIIYSYRYDNEQIIEYLEQRMEIDYMQPLVLNGLVHHADKYQKHIDDILSNPDLDLKHIHIVVNELVKDEYLKGLKLILPAYGGSTIKDSLVLLLKYNEESIGCPYNRMYEDLFIAAIKQRDFEILDALPIDTNEDLDDIFIEALRMKIYSIRDRILEAKGLGQPEDQEDREYIKSYDINIDQMLIDALYRNNDDLVAYLWKLRD